MPWDRSASDEIADNEIGQSYLDTGSLGFPWANVHLQGEDFDQAERLFSALAQRTSAVRDKAGEAEALVGLAASKLGKGDLSGAAEAADRAAKRYEDIRQISPDLLLARARIAAAQGDLDKADGFLNEAIRDYRMLGDKRGGATALRYAADFRAARMQSKAS